MNDRSPGRLQPAGAPNHDDQEAIEVAEENKITDAAKEGSRRALSQEDHAILADLIKREKRSRIIREWLWVIWHRAREWALVYVAITTAIVAGREQIVTFLHWIGLGGGKP